MATEPTLADWRRIYEAHKQELPNRRFTMQHGRPGRWPDDEFGPDRGPDEPRPDDGGDLLVDFIARRSRVGEEV
ncbi:MAG TPA: hypothetical protein VIU82_21985 [Bosea sp. (in: a-proteobacteria)]